MDVTDRVTAHYGNEQLAERILDALREHGIDVEHLTVEDLAPIDQLHAGGAPATGQVLQQLDLGSQSHLLDVGCGIGGPARMAAATTLCRVSGVDLTPEFVDCARTLTARVELHERASFAATAGDAIPLQDNEVNAAMMLHVGMNIPAKTDVFVEVRRVLRPGSPFVIFDQMRQSEGPLSYPLPWAVDAQASFVETAEAYAAHLTHAGFTVVDTQVRSEPLSAAPPAGMLTPGVIFGPEFAERVANNIAATEAGTLAAVLITARA